MDRESFGDRDSSVGVATRYGVEGPGSNTSLAEIFRTRSDWPRDSFGTMGARSLFRG